MLKFPKRAPTEASTAPDQGLKSAEYELADQDVDRVLDRPDRRAAPGNPPVDQEDVRRGEEKLDRLITK